MKPKRLVFRIAYRKWKSGARSPGYSMLMPMPHDLPFLLALALRNLASQDTRHLNEVLVIPDVPTPVFEDAFHRIVSGIDIDVRLVERGRLDTALAHLARGPGVYHFQQIKLGIDASRSQHVLLHDADLFLAPGDLLLRQYSTCVERNLGVLGIEPRWGHRFRGFKAVATWEMFASVAWFHRFPPYLHMGGSRFPMDDGKIGVFDTTLLPQYLSRNEIAVTDTDAFVHFNHAISYYRTFTRAPARFRDDHFSLLLFRLLTDAAGIPNDVLPALADLDYRHVDGTDKKAYASLRRDLDRLLEFDLMDRGGCLTALGPFDRRFDYRGADGRKAVSAPPAGTEPDHQRPIGAR